MNALWVKQKGFTIVELLIVIVVIAILASISIVAYNGIQARATNVSQLSEIKAWEQAFNVYRADNGQWPSALVPAGANGANLVYYCLGSNFPPSNGGGAAACRDKGGANSYPQLRSTSGSPSLVQQLGSYISISTTPKSLGAGVTGPWAAVYNEPDRTLELNQIFLGKNGSECPSDYQDNADKNAYSGVIYCQKRILL